MPELKLTMTAIKNLPIPEAGKRVWYHDTETRFLAVRVFSTGKKAFYHYRWVEGKAQQTKLGDFPDMKLEQAQRAAEVMNGAIADGANPVLLRAKAREEKTLSDLLDWWEKNHAGRRVRSAADRRRLELYFPEMLPLKLSAITRTELRRLHLERGKVRPSSAGSKDPIAATGYEANRALAFLRSVWRRAIDEEVTKLVNPAEGIRHHAEQSRDRRLMPEEIERFMKAVDDAPPFARDYVLMSLMTGARKANVLAMAWADIDMEAREWRIPMTKNGQPQVIPLEEQEVELLKRRRATAEAKAAAEGDEAEPIPWVFPGRADGVTGHMVTPTKAWANILKAAKISDFRLHDLRRSLGSLMADSGASLHVIGKALGHKSQAATLIYARLSLDPVRAAKRAALGGLGRML